MTFARRQASAADGVRRPSATADWVRALEGTAEIRLESMQTLACIVDAWAAHDGSQAALAGESQTLTYADLAGLANRSARWALAQGLRKGDRVALLMENEPTFAALWIGLTRVGIVVALLNTRLPVPALSHCIKTAAATHIIVGAGFGDAVPHLHAMALQVWSYGAAPVGAAHLDEQLAGFSDGIILEGESEPITLRDPALLIYTSGTTGLPKAAHVSHFRIVMWSRWFAGIMDARPDDRLYNCLPMYHAVGGVVAVGAMLAAGGTVLVRRGFSAGRFWSDVNQSGATIFQYIGELCRFLNAAPPSDADRAHSLRLCCGNGLRADVWTAFEDRFAIPRIIEFYAATEGSFSLFNLEGKPGAIGRVPPFLAHRSPVALVRYDIGSDGPARDGDGFCIPCEPGEAGEAIGRLSSDASTLATRFEGYTSADESERKVLRSVFAPGDQWFRTGDLMSRDTQGFFFFADRIGDTYRWKGENVSTAAVADALLACPGIADATVYGVSMSSSDGRAGMAALVVDDGFDVEALPDRLDAALPRFAQPVFLRVLSRLERTETFRPKKQTLMDDGFDPRRITDLMFVLDGRVYRPLDAALFHRIASGDVRV